MALMQSIGYEECEQVAIVYTDPALSEINRTITYIKENIIGKVKITYEVKQGIQPGEFAYLKTIISNIKSATEKNPDADWPDVPCPGSVSSIEWGWLIDEPDYEQIYGPGKFPFITEENGFDRYFYDADGLLIGWAYVDNNNLFYNKRLSVQRVISPFSQGDPPFCDEYHQYEEAEFTEPKILTWFYCDENGTPLQTSQTEIKIYEENESNPDSWILKKEYTFQGDKTPVSAACAAACDEDCIELWDPTETYRICLCEASTPDDLTASFPNLDADDWSIFGE